MTGSTLKASRMTEFTLALLEGTGWYQPDYSMADPITYGKGKGCSFLNTPCVNSLTITTKFPEFCSPLNKLACTWTGRGMGVCGSKSPLTSINVNLTAAMNYWGNKTIVMDILSDNCPTYQLYDNLDCEDSTYLSQSMVPSAEYFGEGGKCFMATLYPNQKKLSQSYGFCFKPTVNSSGIYDN